MSQYEYVILFYGYCHLWMTANKNSLNLRKLWKNITDKHLNSLVQTAFQITENCLEVLIGSVHHQHQLEHEQFFLPWASLPNFKGRKKKYTHIEHYWKTTSTAEHILTNYYIDLQDTFLNGSLQWLQPINYI